MEWIVQENLWNEDGFNILLQALRGHEYQVVKVRPFIHELVPFVKPINPMLAIGSTTLIRIAQREHWTPGAYLNKNFDYSIQSRYYPMLNNGIIGRFGDINPPWDEFFIRPTLDSKVFAGTVITQDEWKNWQEAYSDGFSTLTPSTLVIAAPAKNIYSETRLFMVLGKVITGSVYKRNGRLYQSAEIDYNIVQFAEFLATRWVPHFAYCLDIAEVGEGLKVVEINCINSAGFYKSDVSKLVQALERVVI